MFYATDLTKNLEKSLALVICFKMSGLRLSGFLTAGIKIIWIIMLSGFTLSGFKCRDLQFRDSPCRDYGVLRCKIYFYIQYMYVLSTTQTRRLAPSRQILFSYHIRDVRCISVIQ
jgi:hypothetical protein